MATIRSVFLRGCIYPIRPSNNFDILYQSRISGKVRFFYYSNKRSNIKKLLRNSSLPSRVDRDVSQDVIEISKENIIGDEGNPEDSEEGYEEIPSNVDLECEVTAKDANSAISRAKSPFCKKEIHRLYCLNKGKSGILGRLKSGP